MANYNFDPTSRYYGVPTKTFQTADGATVVYLSRRFVPGSDAFATLATHTVVAGERMDIVSAAAFGAPLAYWRICDANDAMRPDDLTAQVGRVLTIPLPQGLPAAPLA